MDEWLTKEKLELEIEKPIGEYPPALKLEPGKIATFDVDFSKPFQKWIDGNGTKKIIPVKHNGEDKVLWLNVRNPLYAHIIEKGIQGRTIFKVLRTGEGKETRYNPIEE